jgi:protein phosphatase inhibitor 2
VDKWLCRPNSSLALSFPVMAASSTSHRPIKGILKNKSSSSSMEDSSESSGRPGTQELQRKKSQKWDESNILATHYPSYKDYDLRKKNEPGNPFGSVPHDGEDTLSEIQGKDAMTSDTLAKKLAAPDTLGTSYQGEEQESSGAHSSKFFLDKQERQRQFELKRKLHYNEGLNIKLARQLISEELQSEVEEDENQPCLHSNY